MGARSRKKLVVRIVLSFVGLLVLAAILVPLLVPSEKWQQIAFDRLEAETGLVASAESSRIGLFPLGLRMSGLQVRDPLARPEYAGLELDLDQVVVTAQLKPLFRGRFEIDEVKLVRPHLVLSPTEAAPEETPDGEAGAPAEPAATVSLALAALSVEDATVELRQPDGSVTLLHGLTNLSSLRIEGADGEATAKGTLDSLVLAPAEGPRETIRQLGWELEAKFAATGESGSLDIAKLTIPGLQSKGQASWSSLEPLAVEANLDLEADVAALAAEWYRPADIEWPEGVAASDFGDFTGSFNGTLSVAGTIDPEAEPAQTARLVTVQGKLSDATGRLLDRADLARVNADVRFADARLDLDPLRIATPAGELTGRYAARPLSQDDARLELAGDVQVGKAMDIARELWPKLLPLMEEGATGPELWPQVSGNVALQIEADLPVDPEQEPRLGWTAKATELKVRPVDIEADFVVAGVSATGNAKEFSLHEATVTGPGLEVRPRLDVSLGEDSTYVTGRVEAIKLDLDEIQAKLAPPVETAMGNWIVGVAHAAEEMWIPPADLSADLDLIAREVFASGHRLTDVSAKAQLKGQKVQVRDMAASLGSGKVTGTADVDYVQDPPQWTTQLHAQDVPATVLLAPDAPKLASALDTSLTGDFSFDGKMLTDPQAAMRQLTGKLSLGAAAGLLRTEPVIGSDVSQFVGQYAPKWKELAFKALDAELTVDQGQVQFDRFLLSGETDVRVGGMVTLDGRCDYKLDVVLPASATPDVGALQPVVDYLRDEDGRFPFTVNVTGPAAKPKVQVDFDALKKRAEEKGKDELEDKVQDTVKDLLGKFKGKK